MTLMRSTSAAPASWPRTSSASCWSKTPSRRPMVAAPAAGHASFIYFWSGALFFCIFEARSSVAQAASASWGLSAWSTTSLDSLHGQLSQDLWVQVITNLKTLYKLTTALDPHWGGGASLPPGQGGRGFTGDGATAYVASPYPGIGHLRKTGVMVGSPDTTRVALMRVVRGPLGGVTRDLPHLAGGG